MSKCPDPHSGPDLRTGILRHVPMLARPGGPKHNEEIYNIFVMAIYNTKRTKTPEDIEQINITSNRVKHVKKFAFFPPVYVLKSRFLSPVLSHRRTHSTDTPARSHGNSYIYYEVANSYEFVRPHSYKFIQLLLKSYIFYELPIRMNLYEWPTPNPAPKPTHHWGLDKSYKSYEWSYEFVRISHLIKYVRIAMR